MSEMDRMRLMEYLDAKFSELHEKVNKLSPLEYRVQQVEKKVGGIAKFTLIVSTISSTITGLFAFIVALLLNIERVIK